MKHELNYRPDVDGLRAVAVLSVLFYHAHLGFRGGFVGVDIFFVISGYLIAGLIRKDLRTGTFSLAEFWLRRIRRILPALAVVTIATMLAGWMFLLPQDYFSLARSVRAMVLMVSNIHFVKNTGYFQQSAEEMPLLHTWSLAVEEQFYLVVPILFLLLARLRRERLSIALLSLMLIASFAASVIGTHRFPVTTFYTMPTRAWELLVGTLLAYWPTDDSDRSAWRRELAALVGLAAIVLPVFLYNKKTLFPGLAALPPVLGTALIIGAGNCTAPRPLVNRFLSAPSVVFVGLISYSLYLWHWPLIVFVKYRTIYPLSVEERLGLIVASLVAGVLSWRFVETPFRKRQFLATRPRLLLGATLAFGVILCAAIAIYRARGFENRLSPKALSYAAAGIADRNYIHELEVGDIPAKLTRYGNPDGSVQLLVWGDSYAMSTLPAIESHCRKHGVTACAATRSSTAPIVDFPHPHWQREGNERAALFNAAVMKHVRERKIQAVLLVGIWKNYLMKPEAMDYLLKSIDELKATGAEVWFMREVPTYPFDVPRSLVRYTVAKADPTELALPARIRDPLQQFYDSLLPKLAEHGVHILDPLPYFRSKENPERILPFDAGGSFYRDPGHLSTHGAMTIEPMFAPLFESFRQR